MQDIQVEDEVVIDPRTHYHNVPGAQVTPAEKEFIRATTADIASEFDYPTVLHVGVFWGCSMWCSRAVSDDIDLVGIDIDLSPLHQADALDATLIESDSTVYGWLVWSKPIHLLMIDGDHHYAVVHTDIAGWVPHVTLNGIVIFHDYTPTEHNMQQFPELEGVKRAVDEYFGDNDNWMQVESPDSMIAFRRVG